MKIKSLLSLLACGVASQLMVGCASTGQYYDFSVPTAAHQKAVPAPKVATVSATETTTEQTSESAMETAPTAPMALEANAAKPSASAEVARTAPLTTAAVAKTVTGGAVSGSNLAHAVKEVSSNKVFKKISHKLKKDTKSVKKANAINGYIKIGLILILAGVLIGILPNLGVVGSIVAIVGVVFLVLGLLEML